MDCIHCAAIQRRNLPNLGGVENPKTSTGELDDDEIKEMFQFNLNEDLVADPLTQTSYDSCGMDSEKETETLDHHLGLARKGSLESRQLTALVQRRDREREKLLKDSAENVIERYFSLSSLKRTFT